MSSLFMQFLREENTAVFRKLIAAAIVEHEREPAKVNFRFELNRFEVTLDFATGFAFLEDVLDPSSQGEMKVELEEFISQVAQLPGPKP
ncbi:conserved hypothetical protein [Burkholderiales bacterium 8X]|nr:conserved hypothetical protein [Burkholderiales bacterium 8X]